MKKIIATILLMFHLQAIATTVIIRPSGAGTYSDATAVGAANRYDCVDETTANNDTDYILSEGDCAYTTFTHTSAGLTGSETISSVQVTIVAKDDYGGDATVNKPVLLISGNVYSGGEFSTLGSYGAQSYTWTVNPNTGTAWTKTVIDAMQIGYYSCGYVPCRCTQIYATITYTGGASASFPTKLLLQGTGK